ncbi:MAG: hypothetical protein ACLFQK_07750 [Fibrobacterota bacterium]
MILSKPRVVQKRTPKECVYEGCGEKFMGTPAQKYCDFHKDVKNRKYLRKKNDDITKNNMLFRHTFNDTTRIEFTCSLPGCRKTYACDVIPRQKVYPKYCEEHRSEFKREIFKRSRSGKLAHAVCA